MEHVLYMQQGSQEEQRLRLLSSECYCLGGVGKVCPVINASSEKGYLNEIENTHRRLGDSTVNLFDFSLGNQN